MKNTFSIYMGKVWWNSLMRRWGLYYFICFLFIYAVVLFVWMFNYEMVVTILSVAGQKASILQIDNIIFGVGRMILIVFASLFLLILVYRSRFKRVVDVGSDFLKVTILKNNNEKETRTIKKNELRAVGFKVVVPWCRVAGYHMVNSYLFLDFIDGRREKFSLNYRHIKDFSEALCFLDYPLEENKSLIKTLESFRSDDRLSLYGLIAMLIILPVFTAALIYFLIFFNK